MALSPKRRRCLPCRWSESLDDLHDYYEAAPRQRAVGRPAAKAKAKPITVTDDWPEMVPITETELRVIEGHLCDELDALFGPLP